MGIENLDRVFSPVSIAVIGAGEHDEQACAAITANLRRCSFKGKIFTAVPGCKGRSEEPNFGSIRKIREPVDLAIIAAPIASTPDIVGQCVSAGAGGAVIISGGGNRIEDQLRKKIGSSEFRIIGPNCLGIINNQFGLNAGLIGPMPLAGKIAFLSQSGAVCSSVLDLSNRENIGFSYFVNLGSMLDVDFGDMIDYLGGEPTVGSIVMYVEHLHRIRNFMSAARAVSRLKPIIVLKAGRTHAGARAAAAHSGARPGDDDVYEAAFRRAGIVRVKTFEELFDCAEILAKRPRIARSGLAVITNAGGPGVMATDTLADYGLEPAQLQETTQNGLEDCLGQDWSRANPIDIHGDATAHRFCRATEICLKAPEVDALLILLAPRAAVSPTHVAEELTLVLKDARKPVFTAWMGGPSVERGRDVFNTAGIPTFETPERAVRAFADLYRYSRNIELLQEIPPRLPSQLHFRKDLAQSCIDRALGRGGGCLPGSEAESLLGAYGIHRAPAVSAPDYELQVGSLRDPDFGPVLWFGLGGNLADVRMDRCIALPPLNRLLARRMMQGTRIYRVLSGHNGRPQADLDGIEEILIRLSQLVTDFADIAAIDINPLLIRGKETVVAGATVMIGAAPVKAPMHLVISSYPNEYESDTSTSGGHDIFIRPIRPEDAPLLLALFEKLSPRSVYLRFFSPLKQLSRSMLARFTQIDYDREIALVALSREPGEETLIGVARLIVERNGKVAEFAVLTGDPWQGKGIGAELLRRCLEIARDRCIERVWGIVLSENTNMLALGRKLAFTVSRISGASEYRLEKNLQ